MTMKVQLPRVKEPSHGGASPPAKKSRPPAKGPKEPSQAEPTGDTDEEIDVPWSAGKGHEPFNEELAGPETKDEATDVEQVARQRTQPTTLPISRGDLKQRPFGELLAEIHRWRAEGALLVSRGQDKKVVYFRAGRPVFIKSNVLSECLGRILMREKLISEADCEESLRRMKESYRQQGTVLIDMGRISPHNLVYALGLQLQEKLFDLFGWQEGRFEFDTRAEIPAQPIELELTTAAIIYEGIKRGYSDGRVTAALHDVLGRYPVPAQEPLYRFQDTGLDEEEALLLASIDGRRTTDELTSRGPLRPMAVRRFLLAMRVAQLLEFEAERRAPERSRPPKPPPRPPARPKPVEDASAGRRAEAEGPKHPKGERPPPSRETASNLASRLGELRRKDHFEVLGIGRNATAEQLRKAYLDLAKEYHPDKHYSSASAEVRELASEIYHLVSSAFETLSNAEERRRYLAELAEGGGRQEPDTVVRVLAAEGKFQRGQELLRKRQLREATQAFQEAVNLYDEEGEFHAYLGWCLFQASPGSPQALTLALDAIEKAIRLNPKVDKSYLFLGYIHKATGRADKAERQFEKALQCNPDCLEALHELRLLGGQGRS